MLYGRTNGNQMWELKKISRDALLYTENTKVLPIPGLMRDLQVPNDAELFFYVFSYIKNDRFVFVTTQKVDFLAIDTPENVSECNFAMHVKGALWDVEKGQFVSFNDQPGKLQTFVLYDCGIPNVVIDRETKIYTIFYLKGNEHVFRETKARHQPGFVSMLWKKNRVGRPINNRLVFFHIEGSDCENMLILHEEISFDGFEKGVSFVEVIPLNTEGESSESFFRSAHKEGNKILLEDTDAEIEPYCNKHLSFDDAVVVEQPYEDYNIIFVDDGNVVFDDTFDCFSYEKVFPEDGNPCRENIIKVDYRKSDIENGHALFNVTTGTIT